jgi:hypothetical protein
MKIPSSFLCFLLSFLRQQELSLILGFFTQSLKFQFQLHGKRIIKRTGNNKHQILLFTFFITACAKGIDVQGMFLLHQG